MFTTRTMSLKVTFYSVNNARKHYNVLFAPVKIAVIYIKLYPKENIYGMYYIVHQTGEFISFANNFSVGLHSEKLQVKIYECNLKVSGNSSKATHTYTQERLKNTHVLNECEIMVLWEESF